MRVPPVQGPYHRAASGCCERGKHVAGLLEASRVANSNLRALDIFDSVNITLDSGPPELPGTTNVVIEVVESKNPLTGQIGAYTKAEVFALVRLGFG